MLKESDIKLSIIIPVFNEEATINLLYEKIKEVMENHYKYNYEVIFIDDGSTDSSYKILKEISALDKNIKVFKFLSNKGQHKAIESGFQEARGEFIITMDGDMQNDPCDIPNLILKLEEGFEVVCGWRKYREDTWGKIIKSRIGNYIQSRITKIKLHDMACAMRGYRRYIVKGLTLKSRSEIGLIPYILSKRTNKITEVEVLHHRRQWGKSKYGFFSTMMGVTFCYMSKIIKRN